MYLKTVGIIIISFLALIYFKREDEIPEGRLKGRKVLITGASSGIGESLAYEYAKSGASVFITARRESLLKQVIAKCKEIGLPDAVFDYYVADMSDYTVQSELMVNAGNKKLGGIDSIIVNHVYMPQFFSVWSGSTKDLNIFDKMTDVNLKSYVHIVSHALPYVRKTSTGAGRIGVVGSQLGKIPAALMTSYCSSKFALDGFFSSLRLEIQQSESNVSVTYGIIGGVATALLLEQAPTELEKLDISKFIEDAKVGEQPLATSQDVAHRIMVATESGKSELFYPYVYVSRFFTMPRWWAPVLRNIYPKLVELAYFPKGFYDNYLQYKN